MSGYNVGDFASGNNFNLGDYTDQLARAYKEFEPLKRSQLEWQTGIQTDAQKELASQGQRFNLEQLDAQFGNQKELADLEQQFGLETLGKQTGYQKELARQSNDLQIQQARANNQLRLKELARQNQYNLANQMAAGVTGFLFN